ncbi:MAG: hypothetical protein ACRC78_09455 [Planktothrix sp.]
MQSILIPSKGRNDPQRLTPSPIKQQRFRHKKPRFFHRGQDLKLKHKSSTQTD